MNVYKTDFRIGKYWVPVQYVKTNRRIFFKFGFNRQLMEEIKTMSGVLWHGFAGADFREIALSVFKTDKIWSVADNHRNAFQISYLQGSNPYELWDDYLKGDFEIPEFHRPLREHQKNLVCHGLHTHMGLWAAEMGTGKTLAAIELMERSGFDYDVAGEPLWWYVAPKSALRAVELDFKKWGLRFRPQMMTYEGLVKQMKGWPEGKPVCRGIIYDESQKIKTPTSQRSEAAYLCAEAIRSDWGDAGYVILMSGSPAPKAPTDWWHQCEVAKPGFLKEGTFNKFRLRLGLHEEKESFAGGTFMERLTWLDDERKCALCGKVDGDAIHDPRMSDKWHEFQKSKNEIETLYKRMKGLVVVVFKKDVLDLPDKQYRIVEVAPLPSMIRAARLATSHATTVASALAKLRELSDGFQYVEVPDGRETCPTCNGRKVMVDYKIKPEHEEEYNKFGLAGPADEVLSDSDYHEKYFDSVEITCTKCAGHGEVDKFRRETERVPTPKDDVFKDVLEEHEDVGRLVVYAGFTGSVDKCVEIALNQKWAVIRWDGSGLKIWNEKGEPVRTNKSGVKGMDAEGSVDPLVAFQEDFDMFPRLCFIGNAGAAGTGLTLTASPTIFYYSNSFNGDDRIQSEDRIHRMGMDENRGATIIDVFHLPSDKYVHTNLKEKRRLQDLSMGDLNSIFNDPDPQLIPVRT